MARGRPSGQMTHRRRQVLGEIIRAAHRGERLSLASVARRCGLYDYREARRIVADLRKLAPTHDAIWIISPLEMAASNWSTGAN